MKDIDKEWLIERFYPGEQLHMDRKYAFERAVNVWGFSKVTEKLKTLLALAPQDEWLPVWLHVHRLPEKDYEYGEGWSRSRAALLLPLVAGLAPMLLPNKKVSYVTLERAIELWPEVRAVLGANVTLRIRNVNTGEVMAWEVFE